MRRGGLFLMRLLVLAAAFAALPAVSLALEEQSLLTPDGTLHVVRAGRAVDLAVLDPSVTPESFVVDWTSRAQDGVVTTQILPGAVSSQEKRGLQLGWDDQTSTLLLVWTEEVSAFSHIRVGVFHDGVWTNSPLLPKQGISRSYNPQMRITHQRVTYLDEHDAPVVKTSSILSVIWWEEGQGLQARLATLFLDEAGFDPSNLGIYDLPALTGGTGATVYNDVPSGAYLYPGLQPDGLTGAMFASYADLHADRHRVLRISFPEDQGQPSDATSTKWKRRHIPIVGVASEGPVARMTPTRAAGASLELAVGTTVGVGYRPTLYWRDGDNLKYVRLEGADWSPIRSIAI
ncbi:MAG: hypothetical protein WAU32_08340, partial [Thermoanaerobaculia bacterium]